MNKPAEPVVVQETVPNWVGGRRVESRTSRFGEVTNPATGTVVRRVRSPPLGKSTRR